MANPSREYIYRDMATVDDEDAELRGVPMFHVEISSPGVLTSDSEDDSEASENEDEESLAAMKYLASVARQVKEGPAAVVATSPERTGLTNRLNRDSGMIKELNSRPDYSHIISENSGLAKKLEYFLRLREDIKDLFDTQDRRTQTIDFPKDIVSTELLITLDEVSIVCAVEDLERRGVKEECTEWLFALLACLPMPLLEDTAAALQSIRKACERREGEVYMVIASIIAHVFGQR